MCSVPALVWGLLSDRLRAPSSVGCGRPRAPGASRLGQHVELRRRGLARCRASRPPTCLALSQPPVRGFTFNGSFQLGDAVTSCGASKSRSQTPRWDRLGPREPCGPWMSPELSAEPTQASREERRCVAWLEPLTSAPRVDAATQSRPSAAPRGGAAPGAGGIQGPRSVPATTAPPTVHSTASCVCPPPSLTTVLNCPPPSP